MVIGLSGASGSGKNTVAKILQDEGMAIIDADSIAHEVLDANTEKIIDLFSSLSDVDLIYDNGVLNRKKLGAFLFKNPKYLKQHEDFILPKIVDRITIEINKLKDDNLNIVLNAPTLHKTNLIYMCDVIIYIDACYFIRLFRIMHRDKLQFMQIVNRFMNQKNNYMYYKKSGVPLYTIKNNISLLSLNKSVKKVLLKFTYLE